MSPPRGRPTPGTAHPALAALTLASLALGCGSSADATPGSDASASGANPAAPQTGQTATPADWPATFALGEIPTEAEIAALDIDVGPDGVGLPPGSGSPEEGRIVFDAKCAACHGPTGREGPNDRLVGREPREGFPFGEDRRLRRTVGNYWPYATTLFDYVNRTMPFTEPGSLTANEVYAVAAYVLYLNEIIPEDAVMNAETLPAVVMPARDRFVPDNRTGGAVIR